MQKALKKAKVIVALSGGVDSSVAAALLKRANFDLVGVFMKFWAEPLQVDKTGQGWNRRCSAEAAARARAVCQKLSIPFYVLNVQKEFKKAVVDYFLREYKQGRTPNPCVVCNKEIKFRFLLKKMLELKADFIATGHYARTTLLATHPHLSPPPPSRLRQGFGGQGGRGRIKEGEGIKLLRGKDKQKDQTYFLWQLGQRELKKILLPIGDYTKAEVRQMAKKWGLPTANTKESQEVCFIETSTFDFLKEKLGQKPGPIQCLDLRNLNIGQPRTRSPLSLASAQGRHQGLWFYTLGQRKGIGLPGGPYYVLAKNLKKNELVVTKNKKALAKKEVLLKNVNWLSGRPPIYRGSTPVEIIQQGRSQGIALRVKAQIRYNSPLSPATLTMFRFTKSKHWKLVFARPQFAPSPGQSAVFYKGQELLGGGVIT